MHATLFVDFFFVLSGFVIAANYISRVDNVQNVRGFMWRRIGRLYPLHLAIFLAYIAFEVAKALGALYAQGDIGNAFTGDKSPDTILSNLFLVHAFGFHDDVSWNRPSWSISTELCAYFVFAITTLYASRFKYKAYLAIIAASVIWLLAFSEHGFLPTAQGGVFRCLAGFFTGVLCWRTWKLLDRWDLNVLVTPKGWAALEIVAVGLVAWFVTAADNYATTYLAPLVFFFAVLVFSLEGGPISRWAKTPFLTFLGMLSYSLYMTHQFIIDRMINVAQALESKLGWTLLSEGSDGYIALGANGWMGDLLIIPFLAMVVMTSWATYTLIERPCRDYLNRYTNFIRFGKRGTKPEAAE